jgi:hypothetical protein
MASYATVCRTPVFATEAESDELAACTGETVSLTRPSGSR